jgi:hypothetical protein
LTTTHRHRQKDSEVKQTGMLRLCKKHPIPQTEKDHLNKTNPHQANSYSRRL